MNENYVVFFDQDLEFLGFSELGLSSPSFGYFEHSTTDRTMMFSSIPEESCTIRGGPKENCGFFQVVKKPPRPMPDIQLAQVLYSCSIGLRDVFIEQYSELMEIIIDSERVCNNVSRSIYVH